MKSAPSYSRDSPTRDWRLCASQGLRLAGQMIQSKAEMVELYEDRLWLYGPTPQAMYYKTDEQHRLKLRAFAWAINTFVSNDQSILDAGAGYGELVNYIPDIRYLGVELCPTMVTIARARFPRREVICGDLSMVGRWSDWVVLAGVVNSVVLPDALLADAWRFSATGLLVDLIENGSVPASFKDLNRFDMGKVQEYMKYLGAASAVKVAKSSSWSLWCFRRR